MSLAADVIAPAAIPSLVARSEIVGEGHPFASAALIDLLPAQGGLAWVRDGAGLVGWGEAARLVVRGRERFSRAQRWWADVVREAQVHDGVHLNGIGRAHV